MNASSGCKIICRIGNGHPAVVCAMVSAVLPVLSLHTAAGLFLTCLPLITAEVELFFICLLAIYIFSSLSWPLCFWKEGWVSKGHWRKDVTVIIISETWGGELQGRELGAPWDSWSHSHRGLVPKPQWALYCQLEFHACSLPFGPLC